MDPVCGSNICIDELAFDEDEDDWRMDGDLLVVMMQTFLVVVRRGMMIIGFVIWFFFFLLLLLFRNMHVFLCMSYGISL